MEYNAILKPIENVFSQSLKRYLSQIQNFNLKETSCRARLGKGSVDIFLTI